MSNSQYSLFEVNKLLDQHWAKIVLSKNISTPIYVEFNPKMKIWWSCTWFKVVGYESYDYWYTLKFFQLKIKACLVNAGCCITLKYSLSSATVLAANFQVCCKWYRIMQAWEIVSKLLRAAIWIWLCSSIGIWSANWEMQCTCTCQSNLPKLYRS